MKNRAEKVAIVGAGVMGSSIALACAASSVDVALIDIEDRILERARKLIGEGAEVLFETGFITDERKKSIFSHMEFTTSLKKGVQGRDLIIEAVPEKIDLKRTIFTEIEENIEKDSIVASNTSGINVFEVAHLKQRERLVILHFFNPAHIIPLVEIVRGPETSNEVIERSVEFAKNIGKKPIVMERFAPGFIVNRIQKAIGETVLAMIEEGVATPEEIDYAVKLSLGVRLPVIGVVQTFDFQGLDMLYDAMKFYGKVFSFIEEKVKKGELGVKTSKGIYDYKNRSETEILRERDIKFLKVLRFLGEMTSFEPVK